MATVFNRDKPSDRPLAAGEGVAYEKGRLDENRRLERDGVAPAETRVEAERAYVAGRRDERHRRRGASPLLSLILLIVVAFAAVMVYLAVRNGSFTAAGQKVDNTLSNAAAPVHNAADKAGNALENAGSNLKQTAGNGGS